jgi:hypothetical protein
VSFSFLVSFSFFGDFSSTDYSSTEGGEKLLHLLPVSVQPSSIDSAKKKKKL